jgi:hypothetical protein
VVTTARRCYTDFVATDSAAGILGRAWLDNWRLVGAELEADRTRHLRSLDDDTSWDEAHALFLLWEPDWTGDDGDGLVRQQDVFALRLRANP